MTTVLERETGAKRASIKELHEFANKVRQAGGGNPIDALMPAAPEDIGQCLVAKNLNFNCNVGEWAPDEEHPDFEDGNPWYMTIDDEDLRDRIANAVGLKAVNGDSYGRTMYAVRLPDEIGQVAADFDHVTDLAYILDYAMNEEGLSKRRAWELRLSKHEKKLFRDMWPYVDQAYKEAYNLADIVTDDGKIVIR